MDEKEIICGECGKRRATWHLTDFVDGKPVQRHLCEECYAKLEGTPKGEEALLQMIASVIPGLKEMATRQCPSCGLSYLEFRQSSRLGCPNDYVAFGKPMEELLERIHGATRHTGKAPLKAGGRARGVHNLLRALRKQLKKAVAEENYELAAKLRDRIRQLQEQHGPEPPEH